MKGFNEIINAWKNMGSSHEAAKELTLEQVEAFESIVNDDESWEKMLEVFRRGRANDSWLASNWPAGFDELVLCAPLCKLVDWECALCHVGKRQNNFSCGNEDSLFGYIAVLISLDNKDLLKVHLQKIKQILQNNNVFWDMKRHELFLNSGYSSDDFKPSDEFSNI